MDYFPALLALYSGGIAAIANKNYKLLNDLFTKSIIEDFYGEYQVILLINNLNFFNSATKNKLPSNVPKEIRLSDYLYSFLKKYFKNIISQSNQYKKCFDEFEYMLSLVYIYLFPKNKIISHVPFGCFKYHNKIIARIVTEAEQEGDNWMPLKAGLFDGSIKYFLNLNSTFNSLPQNSVFF